MQLLRNLTRHKLRSFLTISGIVIGVLALTTMGAMAEHFNALLGGGVKYYSGSVQVGAPDGQAASLLPLTKIDEIKEVAGVKAAFPEYAFLAKPGQVTTVSFGPPDMILAGDPNERNYSPFKLSMASGRYFDPMASGEVVLGSTFAQEFNKRVGDTIYLPVKPAKAKSDFVNHPFRVVGIMNPTLTAPDTSAYIDITDGQMLLKDSIPAAVRGSIDVTTVTEAIVVYSAPGTSISDLDQIADRINNSITGVKATRPSDLVNSFESGGAIFTAITTAAAVLALVIGGLSVVNTMFMAVAERVREIGLKKAIGATTVNIMGEFLMEATFIGVVGGVIGFGLGALITVVANATTPAGQSTLFLITPTLTILAIGFATVLGAVAGVLPAWRASRLDPVTALRNE